MSEKTIFRFLVGLAGVGLLAYIAFWAAVIAVAVLALQHFNII